MEETNTAAVELGQVVCGHEVIQPLGEGGMGAVYLARHQQVGTLRALKVIHDDAAGKPSVASRFKREALALGKLQHPGIIDVIDYGHLPSGCPFLLLEYVKGCDLHDLLWRAQRLALSVALQLLLELAKVLEYAHSVGVVHRDLKPGNVLLRDGDYRKIKVIDFGLVKLASAEMLTRLTTERQILGSPHYMAPEQAMASPEITGAADIYALAGIAYRALSGEAVFAENSPLALVFAQARRAPERLSARVDVPARLDEVLHSCLEKAPAARPSAAELRTELEEILVAAGGQPLDVAGVPTPPGMTPSWAAPTTPPPPGPSSPAVELSNSMVREREVASAADFIFTPAPVGNWRSRRIREALQRQMLAVVGELAGVLAPSHPDIASRQRSICGIEERLSDLELEMALLSAEPADVELEERRAKLAGLTLGLRRQLDSEQCELAVVVDRWRSRAPVSAGELFSELEEMLSKARSLDGGVVQ